MLRLKPTVISLSMSEVKEFESRRQAVATAEAKVLQAFPELTVARRPRWGEHLDKPRLSSNLSLSQESTRQVSAGKTHLACGEDGDLLADDEATPASRTRLHSVVSGRFVRMTRLDGSDRTSTDEDIEAHGGLLPDDADVSVSHPSSDSDHDAMPAIRTQFLVPPTTPPRRSSLGTAAFTVPARRRSGYHNIVSETQSRRASGRPLLRSSSRLSSAGEDVDATPQPTSLDVGTATAGSPSHTPSPGSSRPRLQVYNDSLPASSQPQTPRNLAEARHQSRLQGWYSVPARHASRMPVVTPDTASRRRWRGQGRRSPSPLGIQTPGLRGLYGGMENGNDAAQFEEALRDLGPPAWRDERPSSP